MVSSLKYGNHPRIFPSQVSDSWTTIQGAFESCMPHRPTCAFHGVTQALLDPKPFDPDSDPRTYCWLETDFEVVDFKRVTFATVDEDGTTNKVPVTAFDDRTWYTPTDIDLKCSLAGEAHKISSDTDIILQGSSSSSSQEPPAASSSAEVLQKSWLNYMACPEQKIPHSAHTFTVAEVRDSDPPLAALPPFGEQVEAATFKISSCGGPNRVEDKSPNHNVIAAADLKDDDQDRWLEVTPLAADGSRVGALMYLLLADDEARIRENLALQHANAIKRRKDVADIAALEALEKAHIAQHKNDKFKNENLNILTTLCKQRLEDLQGLLSAAEKKVKECEEEGALGKVVKQLKLVQQELEASEKKVKELNGKLKVAEEKVKELSKPGKITSLFNKCCPFFRRKAVNRNRSTNRRRSCQRGAAKGKKAGRQRKKRH